jgi:hypothetical protein
MFFAGRIETRMTRWLLILVVSILPEKNFPQANSMSRSGLPDHRMEAYMPKYVASIDQGTTSTRCILFDHSGNIIAVDQKEHRQIYPKPGWVEHDALEIWENTQEVMRGALGKAECNVGDIAAIGITNQRETTLVWEKATGRPVYNASSGRTRARTPFAMNSQKMGDKTASDLQPACPWQPTSPVPRSNGSWRTSRGRMSAPKKVICSSVTWTPG